VTLKFDRGDRTGRKTDAEIQLASHDYHWDDVKAFEAVADAGSLRSGAHQMGIAVNTLRYRIKRLEEQFGAILFRRTKAGVELTDAGHRMKRSAIAMRNAAESPADAIQDVLIKPGQISIACSEAIGSMWLTPQLSSLKSKLPELTIGLHCDYDLTRNFGQIADIGIGFSIPDDDQLLVSKLGVLHFMPYAAPEYLKRHGKPETPEDLRHHNFIEQEAPGVNSLLLDYLVGRGDEKRGRFIGLRTNSSSALYFSVADGVGIAAMPTYFSHIAPKLVAIDLQSRVRFDMYYFFHRDARNSPSVRTTIDWLKAAFDSDKYPYFADEFIHPDQCRDTSSDGKVVSLFPKSSDY
jgi:DNA-binding transcriptional LysR family regulator